MKLSSVAGLLWVTGFLLNCILLAIILFKRREKSLPVFCMFIGFSALRSATLLCLWGVSQWGLYRTVYIGLLFVDTCLQCGLIWEIASRVFRRGGRWVSDLKASLAWWSLGSLIVASILTALQRPAGHSWVQSAVLRVDFLPSVLMCELFIVMIVLSSKAGLNWKAHVVNVAFGLAMFNFPAVVIDTIANLHGFDVQGYLTAVLENSRKGLYLGCLLYWCYTMWKPEPAPRIMSPRMEGQVAGIRDALVQRGREWSGE